MTTQLISMDSTESDAAANRFDGHATSAEEILSDMQNITMNGLPGWQGAAKEAFLTQFAQIKPYMEQFVTLSRGQAQQLRTHTSNVLETDAHGQRMMGYGA